MKKLIQVALLILTIALGYFLVESILNPIRFKKEKDMRYTAVVQNLRDIRTAQNAYKEVYGEYMGSMDTLINFVKYDSLVLIKKIGEIPEDLLGQITEREAIEKGMISRDTMRISVLDSIFADGYAIDSLRFIPYALDKVFEMGAGEVVTGSKLKVKVFEAKAPSVYILQGMDWQQIVNLNDGLDYQGLKVGSLTEPNTSGNWE